MSGINNTLLSKLKKYFDTEVVEEKELIQKLWSGYGLLFRLSLKGCNVSSVIVKSIKFPQQINHPRGWNTNRSHLRKIKSYQVEKEWYENWAFRCNDLCRIPNYYVSFKIGEEYTIVLEDLDASGFSIRRNSLSFEECKLGLKWLANFHAIFMGDLPENLWEIGTYWHLATRPDEYDAMVDGPLKNSATQLDQALTNCKYQTIVHGDAKVANFCFSEDMKKAAVVDFQYTGRGCGMKDVVYYLGSCLSERDCEVYENELINFYLSNLKEALELNNKTVDFTDLAKEWRKMFVIAWADFNRFLLGWMPTHQKLNIYSREMEKRALELVVNQ